jgi:hypothetical protein
MLGNDHPCFAARDLRTFPRISLPGAPRSTRRPQLIGQREISALELFVMQSLVNLLLVKQMNDAVLRRANFRSIRGPR